MPNDIRECPRRFDRDHLCALHHPKEDAMPNDTRTPTRTGRALIRVEHASAGDAVEPGSLSPEIQREGGGWTRVPTGPENYKGFRAVYCCKGCHKDGYYGWLCTEVR